MGPHKEGVYEPKKKPMQRNKKTAPHKLSGVAQKNYKYKKTKSKIIHQMTRSPRHRTFCFTYYPNENINTEIELTKPLPFFDRPDCRFLAYQLERCPETERLHVQGYAEFNDKVSIKAVQLKLGIGNAHCEPRRGTQSDAVAYVNKVDSRVHGPWSFGSRARQGERVDLLAVCNEISAGASLKRIREEFPTQYVCYRRGLRDMHSDHLLAGSRSFRRVEVHVYYGDTGTGKTRKAIEDAGSDYYILDQGDKLWFDGYEGESTLIIDDYYGWIKYGKLLRLLDGYQFRCEIKGGFTYANWTKVVFTSNKPPDEWYSMGMTTALRRRITTKIHFANLAV